MADVTILEKAKEIIASLGQPWAELAQWIDKATQAFVKGVAEQTVDKMFNSPLEAEARMAAVQALQTLPGFAFCGFAEDEKATKVLKRESKEVLKGLIRKR